MNITCNIITFNEEENISNVIKSAQKICNEIIVVDSCSTDNTVSIAKSLGAKTYIQSFLGFGGQKNFGVQYSSNDWILNLDSDEILDDLAIEEIKKINFIETKYDSFSIPRKNFIGNRYQRSWGPDYAVRLYNKHKCKFDNKVVHESLDAKSTKKIKGNIIHYTYRDYSDFVETMPKYIKWSVMELQRKNKKISCLTPIYKFIFRFIKHYFVNGGIFDGMDGFTISLNASILAYNKYAIVLETKRNKKNIVKK